MFLNDIQTSVQDAVRTYAQKELAPRSAQFEANKGYPEAVFSNLAELGLMGMTAPAEYGGAGLDNVSYALALMELAEADGALSTIVSIQNSIIIGGILKDGTEEQKQKLLPELTSGAAIGAFALTEPQAGSDASALRSTAVQQGDSWTINGTKQFISNAKIGKYAMLVAVNDKEAGNRGMTAFVVPTDTPGYIVDKVEHKLGQAASDTCSIRFENMTVSDDCRLGEIGAGYKVALKNLETGRIGIAAQSVGMASAALQIAVGYARERTSFGKEIIEHQAVGHRLADLAAKLEASRQLVLHAADLKDNGRPCLTEASMAKLVASETAEQVVSGAIQTLGGYGYLEEFGVAKIYRDVRICQIYEGTSDIQRMVIARNL
jgi:alkylation response protein AidB-like acyl-CoA dehydrogenase